MLGAFSFIKRFSVTFNMPKACSVMVYWTTTNIHNMLQIQKYGNSQNRTKKLPIKVILTFAIKITYVTHMVKR